MKILKNLSVFIFNILVILSPLFNNLIKDFYVFASALLFISGILGINYKKINKNFLLISLLLATFQLILQENFLKGITAGFIFFVCINNFMNNLSTITKTVYFLMFINVTFLILQVVGINDIFYLHTNYSNESIPFSISDDNIISAQYLPQFRPSGIFPAPTFLSYFCILILSVTLYLMNNNKIILICIGVTYGLSGSTIGLLLNIIFLIYFFRARFFYIIPITYVIILYVYFTIFEPFFKYNYSYDDLISSTLDRSLSESIYSENPIVLLLISIIFLTYIFFLIRKYKFRKLIDLIPGLIVIFMPLLLHDFTTSLLFSLFLAYGIAMIYTSKSAI